MTAATRSPSNPISASRSQPGPGATPGMVNATSGRREARMPLSSASQCFAPWRIWTSAPASASRAAPRASAAGAAGPNRTDTASSETPTAAAGRSNAATVASWAPATWEVTLAASAGVHWPSPGSRSGPAQTPATAGRSRGATTRGWVSGSVDPSSTGITRAGTRRACARPPPSLRPCSYAARWTRLNQRAHSVRAFARSSRSNAPIAHSRTRSTLSSADASRPLKPVGRRFHERASAGKENG